VDLSSLLSLILELQPFYSICPIDDPTRNDTEDEQLQSEFEDGEIVRIHDEESKVLQDEESRIKENIALSFVI
jgi:hypothetical protein